MEVGVVKGDLGVQNLIVKGLSFIRRANLLKLMFILVGFGGSGRGYRGLSKTTFKPPISLLLFPFNYDSHPSKAGLCGLP